MKINRGDHLDELVDSSDAPIHCSFRRTQFSDQQRNRALKIVAQCDGNLTVAAQRLGISIPTLSRWRKASSVS